MQTCCDPPAKVHLVAQYQPQPKTTHLLKLGSILQHRTGINK